MNVCSTCGQDFSSVEAFDGHRVGTHEYTFDEGLLLDPPRADGRRCLGVAEMAATGWAIDARGRCVHPRELRKRLARGGDTPLETLAARQTARGPSGGQDKPTETITAPGGER